MSERVSERVMIPVNPTALIVDWKGVKKRVQFTTENTEPESLLRPYGGDAQSMLVGLWMDWVCRRRERVARVWIERVCRCQTAVSSPLQIHLPF